MLSVFTDVWLYFMNTNEMLLLVIIVLSLIPEGSVMV